MPRQQVVFRAFVANAAAVLEALASDWGSTPESRKGLART